jgi:Transposase
MKNPDQASSGWSAHRGFGGLDWASQAHAVVIVDAQGRVVEDFEIEHSALGWKKFRERLQAYGSIPFAIETSQGVAVEQLLEAGMIVYPLNPKSAQAYRERKAPSGVKDDRLDAWSFADACRVDGQGWKPLRPEEPLLKELRLLCRDEVGLIEQRTALISQLRHALAEYYPTALEAFEDWSTPASWRFLQHFPTPQALQQAGKRRWEKFLHVSHLWRAESGPRRLELFAQATALCGSLPTAKAKSQLALRAWCPSSLRSKSSWASTASALRSCLAAIPITTCLVLCRALALSSPRGCCRKSATTGTASAASPKAYSAWRGRLR